MVEKFFWNNRRSDESKAPPPQPLLLISGPPSSGKTSLLFQYAFNSAAAAAAAADADADAAIGDNNNHNHNHNNTPAVVFICNRLRLQTKPPFLSQGIDPSSHVFQRILIKYVDNVEGLNNYFAAFHLHRTFPLSVIVDDFGHLFDDGHCKDKYNNPRGRDLAIVRTLALCHNAITHANATGPCKLLLSDTHHGDLPKLLYIYKRWLSSIYTITGDGCGSFSLKNIYPGPTNFGLQTHRTAKYSIALQHLVLEGITEDMESND